MNREKIIQRIFKSMIRLAHMGFDPYQSGVPIALMIYENEKGAEIEISQGNPEDEFLNILSEAVAMYKKRPPTLDLSAI